MTDRKWNDSPDPYTKEGGEDERRADRQALLPTFNLVHVSGPIRQRRKTPLPSNAYISWTDDDGEPAALPETWRIMARSTLSRRHMTPPTRRRAALWTETHVPEPWPEKTLPPTRTAEELAAMKIEGVTP